MEGFRVTKIIGDGNCLFRAVSHCVYKTQNFHAKIRSRVVEEVTRSWDEYAPFIVGDPSYNQPLNNAEDYKSLMSLDGEYGGNVELTAIGKVFPRHQFRVYVNENLNGFHCFGNGSVVHGLKLSGERDAGHYDVMIFTDDARKGAVSENDENHYLGDKLGERSAPLAPPKSVNKVTSFSDCSGVKKGKILANPSPIRSREKERAKAVPSSDRPGNKKGKRAGPPLDGNKPLRPGNKKGKRARLSLDSSTSFFHGDGNSLFRAVSNCVHKTQNFHANIRSRVVEEVTRNWDEYAPFIVGDPSYNQPLNNAEDYKSLMSLDGEYGGNVELTAIGKLFPRHQFRVYVNENLNDFHCFGNGSVVHGLKLSGEGDNGHYYVMIFTDDARKEAVSENDENHYLGDKLGERSALLAPPKSVNKVTSFSDCSGVKKGKILANPSPIRSVEKERAKAVPSSDRPGNKKGKKAGPPLDNNEPLRPGNKKGKRAGPSLDSSTSVCLGDTSVVDLSTIKSLQLKRPYLLSENAHRCPHCSAPLFFEEQGRLKWCCGAGDYHVHILPPLRADFYKNQHFLKDARSYNNLFSFSALGTSHGFQQAANGVSFVKVQGRIYHRIFDLSYNKTLNNTVLYINDESERLKIGQNLKLNENIISQISNYLSESNVLVSMLKSLAKHPSPMAHLDFESTTRRTHGPVLGDVPSAPEISALIKTSPESEPRKVVIWKIGESEPRFIHFLHPTYEAFQYPLIFPEGSSGWTLDLQSRSGKKISQVTYYRHKILSDERFALLRRLSQEYIVDMWCRTEDERLNFIRHHQGSFLRVASRSEMDETIAGEGGVIPGKVYLPSSFTLGPRYMQLKYHDAMAIVSRRGKPSYFLTVTCNPRWPEIVECLLSGQQPTDRPDLCARVFKLRLNKLLRMIKLGILLGSLISLLYVIEFQKRGLPHAHIAFRVEGGGPVNSIEIDTFVWAIIPNPDEVAGRLRELVLQHMIHGPCGIDHLSSPCMDKDTKKCTKNFPKPLNPVTHIDDRGYCHYKRPEGSPVKLTSGREINNQWVVPYNPAILLMMECHCNLEIATTVRIIKYLYKYLYKGPDHARVGVFDTNERLSKEDEIESYVNFRYVSASEAIWRIFEFDVSCRQPNVVALPVHLPNEDQIVFRPGEEQVARDQAYSKLQIYLNRPNIPELYALTYLEFYEKYNIESKKRPNARVPIIEHPSGRHFITKKIVSECVARIHFVSPTLGELYFLRLLLLKFPCSGYTDLRTVDQVVYPTFQATAYARGLLEDQAEYEEAILEASTFKTGKGLRQFYFALLISGSPVAILWDKVKHLLSEDYLERDPHNIERAHVLSLCDLDQLLRAHGRTLADYGLPSVPDQTTEVGREEVRWSVSESRQFMEDWVPKLNQEQLKAYKEVISLTDANNQSSCKVVFIDGPAGTGKTVLLNVITARLRSENKIVLCTASTGIAALNHQGGITAHSLLRLPIDTDNPSAIWGLSNNSQRAELIRKAHLIIIDEAPMAHGNTIKIIDRGLRDLLNSPHLFGGKPVVFAGDFRQIPPIVPNGTASQIIAASLKYCSFWRSIKQYHLTRCQRTLEDPVFTNLILQIGEGKVDSQILEDVEVIPLPGIQYVSSIEELIDFVYPQDILKDPLQCCQRAILSGTNESVSQINNIILQKLTGDPVHCFSADRIVSDDTVIGQQLDSTIINTISQSGVPDHKLTLKIGAVVILIRNLSFAEGLVNGTKLVIVKLSKFYVEARIQNSVETVLIPRITFKFDIGHRGVEMIRRQFPLKLAYGLTINKSQGQTLCRVGVDLRSDVFSHGQLYVALGRVRNSYNLKVLVPHQRVLNDVPHTHNVVYPALIV